MGGQIAILTALNFPDIVKKLILIAPAGLEKFTQEEIRRIERYFSYDAIKNLTKEQIEYNVKLNFYHFPPDAQVMIEESIELSESSNLDFYYLTI
jgi:pimeloyl-ACP methyl ester carboxylesterase